MEKSRKNFKIRAYTKSELAYLYNPDKEIRWAVRLLSGWIRRNRELEQTLVRYGYKTTDRIFTPRQVEVIVDFLGEP